MNKVLLVLSIATTAICWGIYGPVLHWGQSGMASGRLRPFVCVGIAYFAIAIVVPIILIQVFGWEPVDKNVWWGKGTIWSLAGGAAGAIGALGIIMAFTFHEDPKTAPLLVMPLVFGCAPVINTLWTAYWAGTFDKLNPLYLAGMIMVAVGAVVVLFAAPRSGGHGPAPKPAAVQSQPADVVDKHSESASSESDSKPSESGDSK